MANAMVTTEAMRSAAGMVEREWGTTGYRIGVEYASPFGLSVFVVRASDGSEFHLVADRWGQVALLPEDADYRVHLSGLEKLHAVWNLLDVCSAAFEYAEEASA